MPEIPVRMSHEFARDVLKDLRGMHAAGTLPASICVLMLRLETGVEKVSRPAGAAPRP